MFERIKEMLASGSALDAAGVVAKCKAELEIKYTSLLTMEEVLRWHAQNKAATGKSILLREAYACDGFSKLRHSVITSEGVAVKDRLIWAIQLEESLALKLDEGNGACIFEE